MILKNIIKKTIKLIIKNYYYPSIRQRLYWDYNKLLEYQHRKLEKFIRHAKKNYEFYKFYNCYNAYSEFPILDKNLLIDSLDKFYNPKYKLARNVSTSGSTGNPFSFKRTYIDSYLENFYVLRNFDRSGFKYGEKLGYLRSYIPQRREDVYKIDSNNLWMSAYHMDNNNMELYVKLMNKLKIRFLFSYPSSFYIFANFCDEKKLELPYLKAVFVSSEKLLSIWRKKIKGAFPHIELIDYYSQNEHANSLTYCEKCKGYHLNEDYGFTEFLPIEGRRYSIVGTGFLNSAFPMLRYNSGDVFIVESITDSKCGYGSRVVKGEIEGRQSDFLYIDGKYLPGVNFFTLFYHYDKEIKQFQIIQEDINNLSIRLLLKEGFNKKNKDMLLKNIEIDLRKRVGDNIKIYFEIVNQIERDINTGKIKIIKSLVKY